LDHAAERQVCEAADVTIQDLGSIGELVAAVATVATLVYLALQIRGNTVVARAEAKRGAQSAGVSTSFGIAQDPELAALFVKGLSDYRDLASLDKTRFEFLLACVLDGPMLITRDAELGLADDEDIEGARETIKRFLTTPGGRIWFEHNAKVVSKPFYRFVLKELGSAWNSADDASPRADGSGVASGQDSAPDSA
jgi:hypothetical protein